MRRRGQCSIEETCGGRSQHPTRVRPDVGRVACVLSSLVLPFFFPLNYIFSVAGPEGAKNLAGKCPPPDSNPLQMCSLDKVAPPSQDNSQQLEPTIPIPKMQYD